jgi:hypothetical protein
VPTTFVVPIEIERIHHGVYGYRTSAEIPKIAGGAGHPISGNLTVSRHWTYKGKRHSYVNARCKPGVSKPTLASGSPTAPSRPAPS